MSTMAMVRIILLSAFFVQTLSAPSGCTESCNYQSSYHQSHHASSGFQDHASLVQAGTNLNEHNYARPGNWTERNQYEIQNGHGKVHEERGQYTDPSTRVRYFNKNFTTSYGNVPGELKSDQLGGQYSYEAVQLPNNQHISSGSTYDRSGVSTVRKESGYSRVQSQTQSSSTRVTGKNEKLEDFGEYSGHSQVSQHVPVVQPIDKQQVATTPDNWKKVDSYNADGGHGQLFEEEGQYVTGPKRVHYYKKNFTSSYSTSGTVPRADAISVQNLRNELQQKLNRHLGEIQREFHQTANIGNTASATHLDSRSFTQKTAGFRSDDLQTAESDGYRQHMVHHVPSIGTVHDYTSQQHTFADTRAHSPYTHPAPTSSTYGSGSQRAYHNHETYTAQVHPAPQPIYTPHPAVVPTLTSGYQTGASHSAHSSGHHVVDETSQHATSNLHHAGIEQNPHRPYHTSSSYGTYPTGSRTSQTAQYEEHWGSSTHTGGNLPVDHGASYMHGADHTERAHYDRDAYNEYRNRHQNAGQEYSSHVGHSESTYGSGYRASSGLVTGSHNVGQVAHGAADCTEETQQYQHESRYHRKYKRDDHHGMVDDMQQRQTAEQKDFTQQSEEFGQESQQLEALTQQQEGHLEFGQQNIDHQQSQDLTQQTESQLEFGQQTVDQQQSQDLTQQTEGQLEFGQQNSDHQQSQDLTQQTEGQLELGQQNVDHQHPEDLTQQTEGQLEFGQQNSDHQQSQDLTQQTEGQLELGQQNVDHQHPEDLTQQTEGQLEFGQQNIDHQQSQDLTQQTEGQLELGQQNVDQQSQDLTQQTEGHLELGQQNVDHQHPEDLTQQTEQIEHHMKDSDDFTQQTSGKLEFGQQTIDEQHPQDLTQQTEQFEQQQFQQHTTGDHFTQQTVGKLEFGQDYNDQRLEHLSQQIEKLTQRATRSDEVTQQTYGKLVFDQQSVDDQHLEDLKQQTEQIEQQTAESDDFTQQRTNGKLELGQDYDDQRLEHLSQQIEKLTQRATRSDEVTQQTYGKLVFDQQSVDDQHLEDLKQQTEQIEQQTAESDDFTQQRTNGKLEFGQQTVDDQYLEDLTQQNENFEQHTAESNDFMQQTNGKLVFDQHPVDEQHTGDLTQQTKQFEQQTTDSNDFTQQTTNGKLEFDQQIVGNQHLEDLTQQSEQHTSAEHKLGKHKLLNFGQQIQPHEPRDYTDDSTEFRHQNEGMTQSQYYNFEEPKTGHMGYGQQKEQQQIPDRSNYDNQYSEQFSQQSNWDTDRFSQQTFQYPSYNADNNKQSEWNFGQISQKTDDFNGDFTQQTNHEQVEMMKPAPKPRPVPRFPIKFNPPHTDIDKTFNKPVEKDSETDIDNITEKTLQHDVSNLEPNHYISKIENLQNPKSNGFEKDNTDHLDLMHKSNDATVGLQWHYAHHPSDLTNIESSRTNHYPYPSMSQQTEQQAEPVDFDQQITQGEDRFANMDKASLTPQSSHNEYNQQTGSYQETESRQENSNIDQNSEDNLSKVIPLQHSQDSQQTSQLDKNSSQTVEKSDYKPEPRILQAFGVGSYNNRIYNDDIYSRITPNPRATLPPLNNVDSWIIREKPRERVTEPWSTMNVRPLETMPRNIAREITTQKIETTTVEQPPPSFWNRVSNKITSTYDKAKQKAKEIFG